MRKKRDGRSFPLRQLRNVGEPQTLGSAEQMDERVQAEEGRKDYFHDGVRTRTRGKIMSTRGL
jgi:hypothetical protein